MQVTEAIRQMVKGSGKSGHAVSTSMGRSPHWLASTLSQKSDPKTSTLALIATACGYDLTLVKWDGSESIRIDPDEA